MKKPILSICIPTYNRADVLKLCMEAMVQHELMRKGEIEIVVCDNASTDETEAVMQAYRDLSYVKYIRNNENCATGAFRKLLNDYSLYTKEGLLYLYEEVIANIKDRPVLLFDRGKEEQPTEVICHSIDDFVHSIGYRLTWMGVYGYWEDDWKNLKDREKLYDKTFMTIDWIIQMFKRKKVAKIYQYNHTSNGEFNRTQRGYNFFKVFVQEYLDLWRAYVDDRTITPALYKDIKKDLWPFVMGVTKNLLIFKRRANFETWDGWKIVFKYYGKEWYFWTSWLLYPFGVVKRRLRKMREPRAYMS